MKALFAAVGAVGLLAGCTQTADEPVPTTAADPMSPLSAPGFMMMAASSDQFEIQSSQMALQMSQNPQVRQFAQQMIDGHTRTTAELTQIAQANGLTPPPPTLMPPQQAALDRIRAAAPADFGATYKREQVAGHEQALTLMQNYASQGDRSALRDFASRTAPVIQQHLIQAQALPETSMMAPPPPAYTPPPSTPNRAGERG